MKKMTSVLVSLLIVLSCLLFGACSSGDTEKNNNSQFAYGESSIEKESSEDEDSYMARAIVDALMVNISNFKNPVSVKIIAVGYVPDFSLDPLEAKYMPIAYADLQISAQNSYGGYVTEWYQLWLVTTIRNTYGQLISYEDLYGDPQPSSKYDVKALNKLLNQAKAEYGWI